MSLKKKKKKITEFSKVECFFTQRSMLEKIFTIFFFQFIKIRGDKLL